MPAEFAEIVGKVRINAPDRLRITGPISEFAGFLEAPERADITETSLAHAERIQEV